MMVPRPRQEGYMEVQTIIFFAMFGIMLWALVEILARLRSIEKHLKRHSDSVTSLLKASGTPPGR